MSVDSAHKSNWEIGEVIFGIPFLIGIAIQFVIPFTLTQGIFRQVLILLGMVLIITGIGVVVQARREFSRFDQPTDPGYPTSKIVKTGVFSISRNPLYLGSVILLLGVALTLNNLWVLITLLLSTIICQFTLIIPEEKYLLAKFGEEYKKYAASVHRWFGHR